MKTRQANKEDLKELLDLQYLSFQKPGRGTS